VAARIEATTKGLDIRYVVTNLDIGTPAWLYDTLYCARGQAENLIKLHKSQLASDRTSCRSPLANQVHLVLHTGAYWLMLKLRDAIPRPQAFGQRRVRHLAGAAAQDRRTHHRDGEPRPYRLRRFVPRGRAVRQPHPLRPASRTVTHGARAPNPPRPDNPQRLPDMIRNRDGPARWGTAPSAWAAGHPETR
jgi:hypothetical protein